MNLALVDRIAHCLRPAALALRSTHPRAAAGYDRTGARPSPAPPNIRRLSVKWHVSSVARALSAR